MSEPNGRARAELRERLADDRPDPAALTLGRLALPEGQPRSERLVLVVDDDRLALELMADTLRSAGYSTITFQDPREALQALETSSPAVIISDYTMPGMNGITLLAGARAQVPNAIRILCTSADDFEVALRAVNSGEVFRMIRKPWREHELLDTVAESAKCSLTRADGDRLKDELSRRNSRLAEANGQLAEIARERTKNLLHGLVAALDCRDSDTQWHSRRVSQYARRLAEQLGVREPELTVIETGALLHDLGKIGIRDEVLRKPGKLTPAEWDEMRRHAELGWSLLHGVEYLRPAAEIVLQHHERWDGTGYPARLGGEDILLGARIFHVVDAVDAITSDRPYRKARPLAAARRELESLAGSHFDPRVVRAFLEIEPAEWERIRAEVETVALLSAEKAAPGRTFPPRPPRPARGGSASDRARWSKKRLGEILLELGIIDRQQLDQALEYQRWHRCKLGVALVELGFASEDDVLTTLTTKLGHERIHLDWLERTPTVEEAMRLVPEAVASARGVVPVECDRNTLTVALRDPTDLRLVDELAFRAGRRIQVLIAGEQEISRAIARLYSPAAEAVLDSLEPLAEGEQELELVGLGDDSWSLRTS